MSTLLELNNVRTHYDKKAIIHDISFSVEEGELACLLGPSGCGKTTILRAISGFQDLEKGEISLTGKCISKPGFSLTPEKRNIGMIFQDHALFPHLNIAENIGFGLRKHNKQQKQTTIGVLLELIGLEGHQEKYPHELSGGQQQRVALARALAPSPKLLLMDEPFSNLDADLREKLGYEVRSLLKDQGITAIMVTHDQHDAFALGDKIGVMSEGHLLQWDTSFNLYHAPVSRFVAQFIGEGVFISGKMVEAKSVITSFGEIKGETVAGNYCGEDVEILLRPDDILHDPKSSIRGKVIRKAFKGAQTLYTLQTAKNEHLLSLFPSHDDYEIGDMVGVRIEADHLVVFPQS